jgi:hypothetical protein
MRACLDSVRAQEIEVLKDVRTVDLRRFIAEQAEHRPSPSSQTQTIAALRSFFRFCVESQYIDHDPAHVLHTPKKREALPDVLDRAERDRLLEIPGKEGVWTAQASTNAQSHRARRRGSVTRRYLHVGSADLPAQFRTELKDETNSTNQLPAWRVLLRFDGGRIHVEHRTIRSRQRSSPVSASTVTSPIEHPTIWPGSDGDHIASCIAKRQRSPHESRTSAWSTSARTDYRPAH